MVTIRKSAMYVFGRASSQTVCQMPELGVYQPTCLPVGRLGSVGSYARTTTTFSPVAIDGVRDIGLERRVSSLVLGDLPAVHPDVGPPVDRSESEPDPIARGKLRGDSESAAIPAHLGRALDLVNSRQLALPRKRHDDRLVVSRRAGLLPALGQPLVLGIEPEFPAAVEIGPVARMASGRGCSGLGILDSWADDVPVQEKHKLNPTRNRFDRIMIGGSQATSSGKSRADRAIRERRCRGWSRS